MNKVIKIGRLLKTDKDDYIISESSADKIASPWKEAVEEIKNAYLAHLGNVVHSIYVRGTVSRGEAMLSMRGFGYTPNEEPGKEDDLREAICAGLPDRIFEKRGRDWYCRGSYEAKKGFDSNAFGLRLIAWEIIEIQTRRGLLPLITNAVVPLAG